MARTPKNVAKEVIEPVEVPVKETKTGKVVKCELLNVREAASPVANIVKTIPAGTAVEILEEVDHYYKIEDGFVMKDFIEI